MPDLQHDLTALESLKAQAETQLATQQADQQAQLQALTDQWTQENTTLAREIIMLSGAIRHVQGQIAREEQAAQAEALQDLATARLELDTEQAETERATQQESLSLMQRIHGRQVRDDAERLNAHSGVQTAFPDNDPD